MKTNFTPVRQNTAIITILLIVYFFVSLISNSHLLSLVIGVYLVSPIMITIIKGGKLNPRDFLGSIFTVQVFKMFSLLAITLATSAIIASPIVFFDEKWIAGIMFAAIYSLIFNLMTKKIRFSATGENGLRLSNKQIFLVFLSALTVISTEITTNYLFVLFPYFSPLYLLSSTTVLICSFVFQATLIFTGSDNHLFPAKSVVDDLGQ